MKQFEYWLDSQPDSTLKRWYWFCWLVSALAMTLGYTSVIPLKTAIAIGLAFFMFSYLALNGLYMKIYPPKGYRHKSIPLLYVVSTFSLLLAVMFVPWMNFIQ